MPIPFGTPINFMIGNHAPCVVTEDAFEYVLHGLKAVGAQVTYSMDLYQGDAVNIIMEGFKPNTARSLAELRRRYPASRFFMIATEVFTPDGFNSANMTHRPDGDHYSDSEYWGERSEGFRVLAEVLDGLIFMAESLLGGYRGLELPFHYLPLVALPDAKPLRREPAAQRDIDIFFSGTVTEYRAGVLQALREEGFNVYQQESLYPNYIRGHFLSRAKLAIGLKLAEATQFTSKQRAHYYLVNRMPHVFESTPDHTDLHEYIQFARPGDEFLDRCYELVNGLQTFPDRVFDDFRNAPQFDPATAFREFLAFLYR